MLTWIRNRLVDDASQAWKWLSVQLASLMVVVPIIYDSSAELQDILPPSVFRYAMAALALLVIIGRLKKQA